MSLNPYIILQHAVTLKGDVALPVRPRSDFRKRDMPFGTFWEPNWTATSQHRMEDPEADEPWTRSPENLLLPRSAAPPVAKVPKASPLKGLQTRVEDAGCAGIESPTGSR